MVRVELVGQVSALGKFAEAVGIYFDLFARVSEH